MAPTRTKDGWIVHGTYQNRLWVPVVIAAVIGVLVFGYYQRFMAFDTVSYELRHCSEPLTADSTWQEVEAAECEPVDAAGTTFVLFEERSQHDPSAVTGSVFTFEDFPVNSVAHSPQLILTEPAETVVVAEPTNEQLRRPMRRTSVDGLRWSGYTGARGPTEYWILVTPTTS